MSLLAMGDVDDAFVAISCLTTGRRLGTMAKKNHMQGFSAELEDDGNGQWSLTGRLTPAQAR
jgi:hypothetical protein